MTRVLRLALVVVAVAAVAASGRGALKAQTRSVPHFMPEVGWAKVPAHWKLGDVSSVAIDAQDHVWIIHRPHTLPEKDWPSAAPPVVQFDAAGNVLQAWGGKGAGYDWPQREHGIYVDHKGLVWIGGNNCSGRRLPGLDPVNDDQLLKFTMAGKFVAQFGKANASTGNGDRRNLHEPSDVAIFRKTDEAFVADGYGNHRVVVLDAETGAFKRMWGAFGNPPRDKDNCPPPEPGPVADDGSQGPDQFAIVHAIRVSDDGFVYVADREHKRIQVFTVAGKFVTQTFVGRKDVASSRTTGALAFSSDAQQKYLYVAGSRLVILERRTLEVVSENAGPGGHHIAADSKGNLYLAVLGRGLQKLTFKGVS